MKLPSHDMAPPQPTKRILLFSATLVQGTGVRIKFSYDMTPEVKFNQMYFPP